MQTNRANPAVRSVLRNLCLGSLIEAVRDQTRLVDLKQVNRVLIQPPGNAIDFFVQVLGLSFHDAMRAILHS